MEKQINKNIFKIFWPLLITFLLTNSFSIIDTIMLSNYNENTVGGVASASQFIMLAGPMVYGLLSGIGIYGSQYFGAGDNKNLAKTFGLSLIAAFILSSIMFVILLVIGESFVRYFVQSEDKIAYGMEYMSVMKYLFFVMSINFVFTFGFRIIKKPKITMYTNILKVLLNTGLNYVLIFGNFGFKEMGVTGAAYATLISQLIIFVINLLIIIKIKPIFIGPIKEMFSFSKEFIIPILLKALPLVISEGLFGTGRIAYSKAYSLVSEDSFSSDKISTNISFLINSFVMATTNTCGILIGAALGKGDMEEVKKISKRLFSFMIVVASFVFLTSYFILPHLIPFYGIENKEVLDTTVAFTKINGVFYGLRVFSSSILAIIRAGGDTVFALIIDSGVAWVVGIPLTFLVVHLFDIDAISLKLITLVESGLKALISIFRFRSKKWMKNLVK